MQRLMKTWLLLLAFVVHALLGQSASAQQAQEAVAAQGRWLGELSFKRHGQQDVVCKLAVAIRNYRIKDTFDCPQVWWLVPGFQWSITGRVDPAGNLVATNILWGQDIYAELTGTLRLASGRFAEQISYGTIRSTAGGDAVLALRPKAGAVETSKSAGSVPKPSAGAAATPAAASNRYDGHYAGKGLCTSNYSFQTGEFKIEAYVSARRARTNIIWQGRDSLVNNNYDSPVSKDGTIRIEGAYSGILVLHLADDPPVFEYVDQCKFPMIKNAGSEHPLSVIAAGTYDGVYTGMNSCTGALGGSSDYSPYQLRIKATVTGARADIQFRATGRASSENRYDFSSQIDEAGRLVHEVKSGELWSFRFADDPPAAQDRDNCVVELFRSALVGSNAEPRRFIDVGTYSGREVCTGGEGTSNQLEAKLEIENGTATFYVHQRHRGGLATYYESVDLDKTDAITIDVPFLGRVVVRLKKRPRPCENAFGIHGVAAPWYF